MASWTQSALLRLGPAGAIYVLEAEPVGPAQTGGPQRRPAFSVPPLSWFLAYALDIYW